MSVFILSRKEGEGVTTVWGKGKLLLDCTDYPQNITLFMIIFESETKTVALLLLSLWGRYLCKLESPILNDNGISL